MMRKMRIALLMLALNLGATTAGAATTIRFEPYVLHGPGDVRVEAEMGTLDVPEVRDRPGARTIPLRFVRLRTTAAEPGPPIVYLAGGPGGSAVGNAGTPRFAFFNRLREAGDVILLEQRGAGLSNTLPSCAVRPIDPTQPLDRANFTDNARRELTRCIAFWRAEGVGVEGYNSDESAADLEDLRSALGVPRLNLVALSYGTHLGMAALKRRLPVERVVFAGLEGLDQTVKLPAHFDAFLERVAAAVRADPDAARAYPDLVGMMRRVHERLEREPARVTVHDADGRPVELQLGAFLVQMAAAFLSISDPDKLATLPALYARMDAGDYQAVGEGAWRAIGAYFGRLDGMPQLMDLSSGISAARLTQVEAQARTAVLGDSGNFPMPQVRDVAPELVLGDDFRAPLETDIPALLVMGTMDGRTPVESQRELLPQFRRATLLTVENGGHNIFEQSEEVQREIVAFLRSGRIERDRIALPPVRFVVSQTQD